MAAIVLIGRVMLAAEDRFLSLEDVAERLQVSDRTVRRWVKDGKLDAYKPGREWRIRPSDLEDFLESRKVRSNGGGS
jgi:excisionase family DNA binding protein